MPRSLLELPLMIRASASRFARSLGHPCPKTHRLPNEKYSICLEEIVSANDGNLLYSNLGVSPQMWGWPELPGLAEFACFAEIMWPKRRRESGSKRTIHSGNRHLTIEESIHGRLDFREWASQATLVGDSLNSPSSITVLFVFPLYP